MIIGDTAGYEQMHAFVRLLPRRPPPVRALTPRPVCRGSRPLHHVVQRASGLFGAFASMR